MNTQYTVPTPKLAQQTPFTPIMGAKTTPFPQIAMPTGKVVTPQIAMPTGKVVTPQIAMPTTKVVTPQIAMPTGKVVTPQIAMPTTKVVTPQIAMPTTKVVTPQFTIPTPKAAVPPLPDIPELTKQVKTLQLAPTIQAPTVAKPISTPKQATGGLLKQFEGGAVGVITPATPMQTAVPTIKAIEETGYSLLARLAHMWHGTNEQIQRLAELRYLNGNYIIDINRRDVINEIIGMLTTTSFNEVVDFLTGALNPEYVLWNQKSLDEGRTKINREITIQQAEEVGVKGVGRCKHCPSTELVFAQKQLRSGDEPMTIFVRCVMCNKQWRQ
jgi:hypothetical protein